MLTLRNDEITLKGARNALLPTLDVYGYLTGQGVAGANQQESQPRILRRHLPHRSATGYGTALDHVFNNSAPR